jgi:hypothetical protein
MKRLLIIAMMILGSGATVLAQTGSGSQPWKKQIALDIGPQFPGGDGGANLETAIGISGTFYYQLLTRNTFISASVGSHAFGTGVSGSTVNVMPLLLGFKYNFTLTGFQPYVGAEFGAYLVGNSVNSNSETEFGFMPKAGFRYPIAAGFDFDASLKYNAIFTADPSFSFLGVNGGIAYTIE